MNAPDADETLFDTADFWGDEITALEIGVIALNFLVAAGLAATVFWVGRFIRRRFGSRKREREEE